MPAPVVGVELARSLAIAGSSKGVDDRDGLADPVTVGL